MIKKLLLSILCLSLFSGDVDALTKRQKRIIQVIGGGSLVFVLGTYLTFASRLAHKEPLFGRILSYKCNTDIDGKNHGIRPCNLRHGQGKCSQTIDFSDYQHPLLTPTGNKTGTERQGIGDWRKAPYREYDLYLRRNSEDKNIYAQQVQDGELVEVNPDNSDKDKYPPFYVRLWGAVTSPSCVKDQALEDWNVAKNRLASLCSKKEKADEGY